MPSEEDSPRTPLERTGLYQVLLTTNTAAHQQALSLGSPSPRLYRQLVLPEQTLETLESD